MATGWTEDSWFVWCFMHCSSYTGLRSFSGSASVAAGIDAEWVWSCMHGMGDMQYLGYIKLLLMFVAAIPSSE